LLNLIVADYKLNGPRESGESIEWRC